MAFGKDLCRRLLGQSLLILCLGCHALNGHRQEVVAQNDHPPARAHPGDDARLAPLLRITDVPTPLKDPRTTGPVDTPPGMLSEPAVPARDNRSAAPTTGNLALAPADPSTELRRLHRAAVEAYAAMPAYSARLRQREQVNGRDRPEEVIACKFRQQPWSVYMKWIGKEANGREVVYVRGRFENAIHSRLAAGDVFLLPAGKVFSIAPENPLARGRSRYPITQAGVGPMIERFGRLLDAGPSLLSYRGRQSRPEFRTPVEAVEQVLPAGAEEALPKGGRRLWFFASDTHLPVLLTTCDERGHEVEYYCYEQVDFPANFSDDEFNPDLLWAKR